MKKHNNGSRKRIDDKFAGWGQHYAGNILRLGGILHFRRGSDYFVHSQEKVCARKNTSEKEHSFSSESQDELSDVFIDKPKFENAKTFRDSPYCGKLDEDLKILIDEHRIDARRLLIEHPVGKGKKLVT